MKANNLSISIPNYGCNKNCPYCVSRMTGYNIPNRELMYRNMEKVLNIASRSDVNSISFTSKGEIIYLNKSVDVLENFLNTFSPYFSCELQTNGIGLNKTLIENLYERGLDIIAISIDKFKDIQKFNKIFKYIKSFNMTIRLTVNLVPDTYIYPMSSYIQECQTFGVDQISFRQITVPNHKIMSNEKSINTKNWIEKNINQSQVNDFIKNFNFILNQRGEKIRDLPYGVSIYNIDGISITYFDYCIQDKSSDGDVRSLIFHEDGHLSTTWYGSNIGRIL